MTKNDSECELAQSINQSINLLYFKRVAHDSSETDDPVATCILLINKKKRILAGYNSGDVVCRSQTKRCVPKSLGI